MILHGTVQINLRMHVARGNMKINKSENGVSNYVSNSKIIRLPIIHRFHTDKFKKEVGEVRTYGKDYTVEPVRLYSQTFISSCLRHVVGEHWLNV
jgi:hypothetical protein